MKTLAEMAARAAEIHNGMNPYDEGDQRALAAHQAAREAGVSAGNTTLAVRGILAHWGAADRAAASAAPAPASAPDPELRARATWDAAVTASVVPTEVRDEDGGTSIKMLLPEGWSLNGAVTLAQHLRAVVPGYADRERAAADAAEAEAAAFAASVGAMTDAQARAAYWRLSNAARTSSAIRALPKALRRRFA